MIRCRRLLGCVLILVTVGIGWAARAQTFTGSNPPGGYQDFAITAGPGATNLAITVPGNATSFSQLLLKQGVAPSDSDYDFSARASRTTNTINLELPEFVVTNYVLRVRTPTNSQTHSFTVTVLTNVADMRTGRPATKRIPGYVDGMIAPGSWQYFRMDTPTNLAGWRAVLYSTNSVSPDVFVQTNQLPTLTSFLKRGTNQNPDTITFTNYEASAGAYFIGVSMPGAGSNARYSLALENTDVSSLTWDPGTDFYGTQVYTNQSSIGGDYYFRIVPQNTSKGAWRTALNVLSGEANLYLSHGTLPTPTSCQYKSERVGSDGFVVPASAFNAGEDWYVLVRANPGSQWTLVSGEVFATDLGTVAADSSSGSGDVPMGAEGMRFFKTVVPVNTVAWRLWLNGLTNAILVKKAGVPVPGSSDLSQNGQLLVVPGYLAGGQLYFIGIAGAPGTTINLDSRQQQFSDLPFAGSTNLTMSGFGYATFRVFVPSNQLAWQVSVIPSSGNPNLAIRRNLVPNENNNDAYSEVGGNVADSVTLVPPGLSDGTFFITVYGTNNYSCVLQSGNPEVTEISFSGAVTNLDVNRVGWRYFKVSDIASQLGFLGWELFVTNFTPGTKIALRRNAAPGLWNYRNPAAGSAGYVDYCSTGDFLQRPGHQADVWYVGVFSTNAPLGAFTLVTQPLSAGPVAFDPRLPNSDTGSRTNVPPGKWQFFRVDVPADTLGWDLRLVNVSSGTPQLVVARGALPVSLSSVGFAGVVTATNWPMGNQWAAAADWTTRNLSSDGKVNENGRILTMGFHSPLEADTYYVGVCSAPGSTNSMSYTLQSRGIGTSYSIGVVDLDYAGGSATNLALGPRDLAVYRVAVSSNAPSWKVKLTPTSGDALMAMAKGHIPNITAAANGSVTNTQTAGKKMLKISNEHFVQLPLDWETNLFGGTYYIVVVSEGIIKPADPTWIGAGPASYFLQSLGPMPEIDLGTLVDNDLTYNGSLEGGESGAFHFHNLPDTLGFELTLENTVGNPVMVSSPDVQLASPGAGSFGTVSDPYGNEGGQSSYLAASPDLITVTDPYPTETVMMKARFLAGTYPDANYTLRVRKLVPQPVAFDGGSFVRTNQTHVYEFYRIEVPTNALGWDLRLVDVLSGIPRLMVSRDSLPIDVLSLFPGSSSDWWPGEEWIAGADWTQRSYSSDGSESEDGRILAMGMGRPLEPGTYYVGVYNPWWPEPMNYTLLSRGIGDGFTIPVVDLPFDGGIVSNESLPPREADYYRLVIPNNAASWHASLVCQTGEVMLVTLTNSLPSVWAGRMMVPGKVMQKAGDEQYLLLPFSTNFLRPGTNFFAVVSEGVTNGTNPSWIGVGTSGYVLQSWGELQITNLGSLAVGTDLADTASLAGGQVCAYQFTVPPGISNLQATLINTNGSGRPTMVLRAGDGFPNPGAASSVAVPGSVTADDYGHEGGYALSAANGNANTNTIIMPNPTNGIYTLMVKARGASGIYPDASYTLLIHAFNIDVVATNIDFDGGCLTLNHPTNSWRYFQVIVPTNALGWDIRLTNVTGGVPKMVVRRDLLPTSLTAPAWASPGLCTNWPSGNQWAAGADWTRLSLSASGSNEDGRLLAMGMGQPLEPGTYWVGVTNTSNTNSTYTILSRGIGDGLGISVADLDFNSGSLADPQLLPREAAYYRVTVPLNSPSWKLDLTTVLGESMVLVLKDHIPNVDTGTGTGALAGKSMKKAGNDHYALLPAATQSNLTGGTYYLAVVGQGLNPTTTKIGTDSSSYQLDSPGTEAVTDLGELGTADLLSTDTLEGGESRFYRFTVQPGTAALELQLQNRVGNPVLVLITNDYLPDPGGGATKDAYGNDGGAAPSNLASNIVTVANPRAGTFTIAVKGRFTAASPAPGVYPDASYTLRVRQIPPPELSFDSQLNPGGLHNYFSGMLLDNQRAFFKIIVPDTVAGLPVFGWQLDLSQLSGLATMRVRKDLLPSDTYTGGMPFTANEAVIAPPFLTSGTWYVEVRGSNSTSFTLTSSSLALQRPGWAMPEPGEAVTTPGLTAPDFGDSGLDTNGVPLAGDQGIDLAQGRYHYYAVLVPTNNGGLLRVQMDAINGNADVYMRTELVPTCSHATNGASGTMFSRSATGNVTEYANWVPLDGKVESALAPGTYYVAVRAVGASNARYRLRVSTGHVEDLDFYSGTASGSVAAGDWRYYRLNVPPDMPANWLVTFNQTIGDAVMYVRDTVPPGNGVTTAATDYKDWASDKKNSGPYANYDTPGTYALSVPPVRPGSVYYLGFRAKTDSTFSVSSSVNGSTNAPLPIIPFYGGYATNWLLAYSQVAYQILTPPDALRWRHYATNSSVVRLYLDNGSMPTKTASDDYVSSTANPTLDRFLNVYPWLPSQTYYLVVTNSANTPQPFSFRMNGGNTNADDDADGLPDWWEVKYFGSVSQTPAGDYDSDGVSNLSEYVEGTNPADRTSLRPRLTLTATNGSIVCNPVMTNYALGSIVTLMPVPAPGFIFAYWANSASGTNNPLVLTLTSNRTVTAVFKVPGDDFVQRIPITGWSNLVTAVNTSATRETGEPYHAGNTGGHSIWWSWTPFSSCNVTISTAGSSFNTVLAVYTGNCVSNLNLMASNDDDGTNRTSRVIFPATAGITYAIAVDGYNGAAGNIALQIKQDSVPLFLSAPSRLSDGKFQFGLTGGIGSIYDVQASEDLFNWQSLGTVTNTSGTLNIIDADALLYPQRFYRAIQTGL